jgi:hypothetical protein
VLAKLAEQWPFGLVATGAQKAAADLVPSHTGWCVGQAWLSALLEPWWYVTWLRQVVWKYPA